MDNADQTFPPCFSSWTDYHLWRTTTARKDLHSQHCTDCLPTYKARMVEQGRCEHAETKFAFYAEPDFDPKYDEGMVIIGIWKPITFAHVMASHGKPVAKTKPTPKPKYDKRAAIQKTEQQRVDYWKQREDIMSFRRTRGAA